MSTLRTKLARLSSAGGSPASVQAMPPVAGEPALRDDCERVPGDEGARALAEAGKAQRLSRLRAQLTELHARVPKERAPAAPSWSWREEEAPDAQTAFDEAPPGRLLETAHGPLRCTTVTYDEDHCHGSVPLARALAARPDEMAILALDPSLAEVDFSRALYIDTETTGLSGGTGTLPFLIGMAWFEGRRLVVEQLFLERPGLEAPMLRRLGERLGTCSMVVSFNGKSFDWPLLRTRFILQRVAAPKLPAHLDLLHCARRVYKRRLGSVRLTQLEQAILGFERCDDIPGALIPQTYLGFLRGRVGAEALHPILTHNRSDLVALAAILGELAARFRGTETPQDARDQLGFAAVAARADAHARAVHWAQAAADADVRGELAPEALYLAGQLKLRRGDLTGAVDAFKGSIEAALGRPELAAPAHLSLAKLFEHKLGCFDAALVHAEQAGSAEALEQNARRCARLRRRLS